MSHAAHGAKQVETRSKKPNPEFFTALFTGILAVTALIALGFTFVQVRDFRESQRVERLVGELREFESPDFIALRRALAEKRLDSKDHLRPLNVAEVPDEMYQTLNYFEHIAILEHRKYLDDDDVWEEFGYWIRSIYADARPVIEDAEKDDSAMFDHFVRLANRMKQIDQSRHPNVSVAVTQDDIAEFYKGEKTVPVGVVSRRRGK